MKTLTQKVVKRTYNLPAETLAKFEEIVPAGKRGAAVNEAIDRWLEERRLAELRADIDEGLREMADIYLETEREFHALEEEVDQKIHG